MSKGTQGNAARDVARTVGGPADSGRPSAATAAPKSTKGGAAGLLALALGVLLVAGLPLLICMPLWPDVAFFDICARLLLRGQLNASTVFGTGPPGFVFTMAGVRALVGWSSEALRLVDVLVLSSCAVLLVRMPHARGMSTAARLGLLNVLALFYLSTTEWSHCQPDCWMLLPALGALLLRQRQTLALVGAEPPPRSALAGRAVLEGLCWGAAFSIKPFIAPCGLLAIVVTAALVSRRRPGRLGLVLLDVSGVLLGGIVIGAAQILWLWWSGNLPALLAANQGGWNEEYYRTSWSWGRRLPRVVLWSLPWSLIHIVAVPTALLALARAVRARADDHSPAAEAQTGAALLAAVYLGWMAQANFVQRQFDYHLVAPMFLGLALVAQAFYTQRLTRLRLGLLALLLLGAVLPHPKLHVFYRIWEIENNPLVDPARLALWPRCWREGSSADLRDRLTLEVHQTAAATWKDLEPVETYLRAQRLRDRELTCFALSSLSLYNALDLVPSTRFVMLESNMMFFPDHWPQIEREVLDSPQRFMVNDLAVMGYWSLKERRLTLPVSWEYLQWSHPVVFHSGRYIVQLPPLPGQGAGSLDPRRQPGGSSPGPLRTPSSAK